MARPSEGWVSAELGDVLESLTPRQVRGVQRIIEADLAGRGGQLAAGLRGADLHVDDILQSQEWLGAQGGVPAGAGAGQAGLSELAAGAWGTGCAGDSGGDGSGRGPGVAAADRG